MADLRTTTRQQEMIIPDPSQSQSEGGGADCWMTSTESQTIGRRCRLAVTFGRREGSADSEKLIPDGGRAITDDAPLMEGDNGPDGSGAATKGTPPMEDREFHGPVT
ncbi:Hypp7268 [Branchiostoma lanceolatum]|uniref:Hypp7268 protein n=1 Tax=Branchiostoma lanceolatum TaxID=7740 RepID=A0A8J9YYR6_BRALA|nr:Hypp7268 [Branchiostoma lanceolatum]